MYNSQQVRPVDSRDETGRYRFFSINPHQLFFPGRTNWTRWHCLFYPVEDPEKVVSDSVISFHKVSPEQMYTLEFLIYNIKLYGKSKWWTHLSCFSVQCFFLLNFVTTLQEKPLNVITLGQAKIDDMITIIGDLYLVNFGKCDILNVIIFTGW